VPEGLAVPEVEEAVTAPGVTLRYLIASHEHYDHLDPELWDALGRAFPQANPVHPAAVRGDQYLEMGGEPLWLVKAPKHSAADVVTVFRGVAMTGDIEPGALDSVTDEVPRATRKRSMHRLAGFPQRTGYGVHTVVSAHLNDLRRDVDWPALFAVDG
jgi:glyoxylase-like metal-dependent hydrolase (beta-lactamase superfamily II)